MMFVIFGGAVGREQILGEGQVPSLAPHAYIRGMYLYIQY